MPVVLLKRSRAMPPVFRRPSESAKIASARIARCGVCRFEWEKDALVMEDGVDRCPKCRDYRTAEYKATRAAQEAAHTAEMIALSAMPQISNGTMSDAIPSAVRKITDAAGTKIYETNPLRLAKGGASASLLLLGRSFSSSDTITASTGISVAVSARTSTQTTLSVSAGGSMTPGEYHLIFNDVYYRNIFSVR